jgi:hypothetical protein
MTMVYLMRVRLVPFLMLQQKADCEIYTVITTV